MQVEYQKRLKAMKNDDESNNYIFGDSKFIFIFPDRRKDVKNMQCIALCEY